MQKAMVKNRASKYKEAIRIRNGLCSKCGQPNDGKTIYCTTHREANRERARLYRLRRKKNKQCSRCGKRTPRGILCNKCKQDRKEIHEHTRDSRTSKGLCGLCGNPAGGFYACETCRKKKNENARKNYRIRREKLHL